MEKIDREELTYGELTALVNGLVADHSSHTFAAVMGWAYVPAPAEVQFYDELDVKLTMNRGKNQPRPPRTKRPWEQAPPRTTAPRTTKETQQRRQILNERLGLTQ